MAWADMGRGSGTFSRSASIAIATSPQGLSKEAMHTGAFAGQRTEALKKTTRKTHREQANIAVRP